MECDDAVATIGSSESLLIFTALRVNFTIPVVFAAAQVHELMLDVVVDEEAHRHDAVAAELVGEGLHIDAAFREGHAAPFHNIAGVSWVGDEIRIGLVDGKMHGDDAVAIALGLEQLVVVAAFSVFNTVPDVVRASRHVDFVRDGAGDG